MIPNNTTSDILSMRHSLKQQHHRFNTTSSHHRSITIPSHNSTSNHIDTSTLTSFISSLQPQTDLSQFMHLLHTDPSQTSLDMDLYLATSPSPPKSNPSPFSLLAQRRNSTEEEGFMGLLSGQRDVERMEGWRKLGLAFNLVNSRKSLKPFELTSRR
ncbi:hypothetical protein BC829DRAFT_416564 [Chytridium lagenaria]|nr:hypothetical protein BC829DRAFT_416564 [Chytridium lagenaria]